MEVPVALYFSITIFLRDHTIPYYVVDHLVHVYSYSEQ